MCGGRRSDGRTAWRTRNDSLYHVAHTHGNMYLGYRYPKKKNSSIYSSPSTTSSCFRSTSGKISSLSDRNDTGLLLTSTKTTISNHSRRRRAQRTEAAHDANAHQEARYVSLTGHVSLYHANAAQRTVKKFKTTKVAFQYALDV